MEAWIVFRFFLCVCRGGGNIDTVDGMERNQGKNLGQ